MPELGKFGNAYRDAYESMQSSLELQIQEPNLADTYDMSITQAQVMMSIFESKGAIEDFTAVLSPAEVDPEIEKVRESIIGLRDTAAFKNGLIEESDIEARLAQLPKPETYSEQDQQFATAYFVGRILSLSLYGSGVVSPESKFQITPEQTEVKVEDTPTDASEIETNDGVHIRLYTQDNMLVFDDNTGIPLARKTGISKYSVVEEDLIETYRYKALRFLAENRGSEFGSSQVWDAIDITGTPFSSSIWSNFVGNYLSDELIHEGQPLINCRKPSPDAKLKLYSAADLNITFEVVDEFSGLEQLTIYKLESGKVLAGKAGALMHLLLMASKDSPVTIDTLFEKGIYTDEEVEGMKSSRANVLSGLVATVNSTLREEGLTHRYRIHREKVEDADSTTNNSSAYWGELTDPAKAELIENIHAAHLAANYVAQRNGLLEKLGLPTLLQTIVDNLADRDTIDGMIPGEDKRKNREKAYFTLKALATPESMEQILNSSGDDPRWELVDYLFELKRKGDDVLERFDDAMRAPAKLWGTDETDTGSSVITRIEYSVSGVGTVCVERDTATKEAEAGTFGTEMLSSPEQKGKTIVHKNGTTPTPEQASPTQKKTPDAGVVGDDAVVDATKRTRRERRTDLANQLDRDATRFVKTVLGEVRNNGLDKPGGVKWKQVAEVFPSVTSRKVTQILGAHRTSDRMSETHEVTVEDILLTALGTSGTDLEKALGVTHQRRVIDKVIKREVEKYRVAMERKQVAQRSSR